MPLKFGIFLEIVEDQTMGEPQMLSPLVLVAGDQGAADWADLLCALEFAISLVNLKWTICMQRNNRKLGNNGRKVYLSLNLVSIITTNSSPKLAREKWQIMKIRSKKKKS